MCGICGILNFDKSNKVEIETIKRMNMVMEHRGPDQEGYFIKNNIGFGHKRLSIIDLKSGQQPIFNENNTICTILNGEIYNFKELREILIKKGHLFKSHSDTEVIVHGYEEYGYECVNYFRGMFSIAIWDSNKNILFLSRDRLGKKPLYYYYNNDTFIFGSEIKSILKSETVNPEVNMPFIDEYLSLGYVTCPNTLLKNIKKLLPGYNIIINNREVITKKYWSLDRLQDYNLSVNDCKEKIVTLLKESISYRMISDVPLGAFLSGGIDSSIIVGLMSKLSKQPIKTFTVGYKNQEEFSELKYAKIIAKYFNTEHHEIILEPFSFYDAIPKMIWHLDEPIADQACIPLWLLSKEAKKYVTVLLSGEGSDELFAGYPIYILMKGIEQYRKLPSWLRVNFTDPLIPKIFGERRGQKYIEWTKLPVEQRYLGDMADLSHLVRENLYSSNYFDTIEDNSVVNRLKVHYDSIGSSDILSKMQYLDIKTWLVDDLLLKADKMTMAASVELRCPFLDHVFVEFSRTIPSDLKLKRTISKYILKKTFEDLLPKEIIYRKKKGFPVPLSNWFKDDLNDCISEVLLDNKSLSRGYFKKEFINNIIKKQKNKEEDYSKLLWSLLILESWHRVFIDKMYK